MINKLFDIEKLNSLDVLLEDTKNVKVSIKNNKNIEHYKNISAKKPHDYQKNRWFNDKQMYSGIKMSEKIVDFKSVKSWVDVGCGTGNFFEYILPKYDNIKTVTAIDAVEEFVDITSKKIEKLNIFKTFTNSKIHDIDVNVTGKFDLVTLSGVLQILDLDRIEETFEVLTSLLNDNGQLWVNTAYYGYKNICKRRAGGIYLFKPDELSSLLKKYDFTFVDSKPYDINSKIIDDVKCEYLYLYAKR